MTQKAHEGDKPSPAPKPGTLAGVAAVWLAGMGALTFSTLPEVATQTSGATGSVATGQETDISPTIYKPAASTSSSPISRPASAATQIQASDNSDLTPAIEGQTVDFIVRFENDDPGIEACRETFHKDKAASRKMFSDWAADYEPLQGMHLKKAAYSGEMILTWDTGSQTPAQSSEIAAKLAQITAMPNVRYADPDYTVQAEGAR